MLIISWGLINMMASEGKGIDFSGSSSCGWFRTEGGGVRGHSSKETRWKPRTRKHTRLNHDQTDTFNRRLLLDTLGVTLLRDTLARCSWYGTLAGHSWYDTVAVTLVGHSHWTLLLWHSCRALLVDTLIGHSEYDTLTRHSWYDALAGYSCKTLLVWHFCGKLL